MKGKVKSLIGKHVCYGDEEGGFRWGRICREVGINTIDGMKEALVLEDGMSCKGKGFPVRRQSGERIIRKDIINLEADIIDNEGALDDFDDEQLFRASLGDMTALSLGVRNMAEADIPGGKTTVADVAADILKSRMGVL